MAGHQNETKRHFQTRQLDKDMAEAAEAAGRVTTAEGQARMKAERRGLIIVLALLVLLLCYLLGVFG
ncbi:hypothetical protein RMS29_001730 [Agrobacterium rosae]|uniref:Uncharacterized protein n=1 Tax=Agrobacterium rosae TaxID=1972867 RepID=A0AAE5S249_9HYPH|nr:hypothetical protein [Agrobacterium rosae]KAA3510845.1 hypothetical protein DXM21_14895 [Agrobacterium rosae]KAA3517882.1 hypothetical protein DXM25_14945 [Agrobacterium rosae]MCM2434087.1 hypothetical protein [Agrobacterium rosae]MDX8329640.1 hypothetical protein [Agrobacterium rosae]MQB49421.1 hypothetical protein [Agrobacterium rosae]